MNINDIYSDKYKHIYIYNEINDILAKNIINDINTIDNKNENVYLKPKQIILHINSQGGSLQSGLSIMNAIINSKTKVISYVEGIAASSATLPLIVSDYKIIGENGFILIHQLSNTEINGTYNKHEFNLKISTKLMEIINNFYTSYTKISHKELSNIMKRDLFLNSKEAKKYNFVDKILENTNHNHYFTINPNYNSLLKNNTYNNIYVNNITNNNKLNKKNNNSNNIINNNINLLIQDINNVISKPSLPILLHINSNIICTIYELFGLVNIITTSHIPFVSIISGICDELSLIISLVSHKRFIYKSSIIIIDFVEFFNKSRLLKDTVSNSKKINFAIKNIFKKKSSLPPKIINNLFNKRFIFYANEALKYKLCDKII